MPGGAQCQRHTDDPPGDAHLQAFRGRCQLKGCDQQGGSRQAQCRPRPAVGTFDDVFQSSPGRRADHQQQADQDGALDAHAFFAFAGIKRQPVEQGGLPGLGPRHRQLDADQRGGERPQLERACNQQGNQGQQNAQCRWGNGGLVGEQGVRLAVMLGIVPPEDLRHQQANADAEQQAQHQPGHGKLHAQDAAGVGQRHDVARRREKQEGDRRADAGAFAVNAGEQRHDGARADRNQRTGQGGGRVGNIGGGVPAQPARDAGFRDERRHGAGDEEGRQQAQQHVCGQVRRQASGSAVQQCQQQFHAST